MKANERYVTIKMIADHASKSVSGVHKALRAAGITVKQLPGKKGNRVPAKEASDFVQSQWPEVGPLHLPQ